MSQVKTLSKDKVPVGQKAAFGASHFILNILPGTLGVFIQFFLLTAWGVDPLWAGLTGGTTQNIRCRNRPDNGFHFRQHKIQVWPKKALYLPGRHS